MVTKMPSLGLDFNNQCIHKLIQNPKSFMFISCDSNYDPWLNEDQVDRLHEVAYET